MGTIARAAAAVLAAVLLAACGGSTDGGSSSGGDSASGAQLPCSHFRNIAGDYNDGVLTDQELRTKLQEVRDDAAAAPPDIREAARDMVAGITQGSDQQLADAVNRMGAACEKAGH